MSLDRLNEPVLLGKISKHMEDMIQYCLDRDMPFDIVVKKDFTKSTPSFLEREDLKHLPEVVMFSIVNYTYTTFEIKEGKAVFETGFNQDVEPTLIEINLTDIIQLNVEGYPLVVNVLGDFEKTEELEKEKILEEQKEKSRLVFSKNKLKLSSTKED